MWEFISSVLCTDLHMATSVTSLILIQYLFWCLLTYGAFLYIHWLYISYVSHFSYFCVNHNMTCVHACVHICVHVCEREWLWVSQSVIEWRCWHNYQSCLIRFKLSVNSFTCCTGTPVFVIHSFIHFLYFPSILYTGYGKRHVHNTNSYRNIYLKKIKN